MQPGQQVEPQQQPQPQTEQPQPDSGWQFHNEDASASVQDDQMPVDDDSISWTASEYVTHDKSAAWFLILIVGAVLFIGIIYLLTRDKIIAFTLSVVAILFGVTAARKPRVLNYGVNTSGITVGRKMYPYPLFKSFSVVQESGMKSIYLMPIKRFSLPVSLYYPPEDEKTITDTLGSHLPYEDRKQDVVDQLMHRIRF